MAPSGQGKHFSSPDIPHPSPSLPETRIDYQLLSPAPQSYFRLALA